MSIATHNVVAPSPEAFASNARSPFPSAPRYGRNVLVSVSQQEIVRCPLRPLRVLTHVEKRPYGKHGHVFTCDPSSHNPYTIQVSNVLLKYSYRGMKKRKCAPAGAGFSSPFLKEGAFKPRKGKLGENRSRAILSIEP